MLQENKSLGLYEKFNELSDYMFTFERCANVKVILENI